MRAGQILKSLRNERNITVRDAEQASRRIAGAKGDKRFCISNGWLAQLENGISEPNIWKLFSLSVIYNAKVLDLIRLYIDVVESMSVRQIAADEDGAPNVIYGYLGSSDFTMYPMIRPGTLLKIDTSQKKLATGTWHNEYERPIFFIELRQAYACGWCELQDNQLLIIPHPSSPASVRRFAYPREAEIVGRVVSYSIDCTEPEQPPERAGCEVLRR